MYSIVTQRPRKSPGFLSVGLAFFLLALITKRTLSAGYSELSAGVLVFLPVGILLCAAAGPLFYRKDGVFLSHMLTLSLLIRVLVVVYTYSWSRDAGGTGSQSLGMSDDQTWDNCARLIAETWREKGFILLKQDDIPASSIGFPYMLAPFYLFFGDDVLVGMLFNVAFGVLTGAFAYLLGKELGDRIVARWAGVLGSFLPQMITWSSWMAKDGVICFCIVAIALLSARAISDKGNIISSILAIIPLSLMLITLRTGTGFIMGIGTALQLAFLPKKNRGRVFMAMTLFAIIGYWGLKLFGNIIRGDFFDLNTLLSLYTEDFISQRYNEFTYTDNSLHQRILGEVSLESFLKRPILLLPALIFTLITPFPFWLMPGANDLVIGRILEVTLTPLRYGVIFLAVLGSHIVYKEGMKQGILIANFSFLLVISVAVTFFGTHPRYLTQVLPLLSVLAAWALCRLPRKSIKKAAVVCLAGISAMAFLYLSLK